MRQKPRCIPAWGDVELGEDEDDWSRAYLPYESESLRETGIQAPVPDYHLSKGEAQMAKRMMVAKDALREEGSE